MAVSQATELKILVKTAGENNLDRLSRSLSNIGKNTVDTNFKFDKFSNSLLRTEQASTKSINTLRTYAASWRELANSVDYTSERFKFATQQAERLEKQVAQAQGKRGRGRLAAGAQIAGTIAGAGVFGGFEGAAGAGIGALVGGVPGAITGGAIGAQVGMVRQQLGAVATFSADLTRQRKALQLVTKDASEYERALVFIRDTSRQLAIPQELITRQFTQLTASVKGAGGSVRDAEKAFTGIAVGIRGTGGSLEQLESALLATSQVFSKGKVSAEELRQQIGERLPGAFSLFAKSLELTPQELDKALEKGQVSLQDFQKFAEKLFDEYGESAQILADGPDAAGDRLQTQLSELKEAIGPTLKDMGAAFQNFASEAIKAFIDLGAELEKFARMADEKLGGKLIDNAIKNIQRQDEVIRRLEAEQMVRIGGLSEVEKQQLRTARSLRAGSLKVVEGAKYGPAAPAVAASSKLPGITEDTSKATSEAEKLARQAQQTFNKTLQQLGVDLDIKAKAALNKELLGLESDMTQAIRDSNVEEQKRIEFAIKNAGLEATRNALLTEKQKLEDLINQGLAKNVDTTSASNKLRIVGNAITENSLNQQRQYNEELRYQQQRIEEQVKVRESIRALITDAQIQSRLLTDEDRKRIDINKQLSEIIGQVYGKLGNEELIALINELRKALEGLAKVGKDFGTELSKSFADVVKSSGDLAANLGSTLGNAFLGLGDQLAEFVNTGKLQFSDFARSVLSDLSRIFIQFALFETLKAIVPSGSAFGKFLGFADGGIMTANGPLNLKRYATGGIANSPQLAMFGEGSMPEAYVPLPDGRSIPVTMKNGS
ncbi:MAG: tape measure protein, partial [Polynucleobacter sp.]